MTFTGSSVEDWACTVYAAYIANRDVHLVHGRRDQIKDRPTAMGGLVLLKPTSFAAMDAVRLDHHVCKPPCPSDGGNAALLRRVKVLPETPQEVV